MIWLLCKQQLCFLLCDLLERKLIEISIFRLSERFHYNGHLRLFLCLNKPDVWQKDSPGAAGCLCFTYEAPFSFCPWEWGVYPERYMVKQATSWNQPTKCQSIQGDQWFLKRCKLCVYRRRTKEAWPLNTTLSLFAVIW